VRPCTVTLKFIDRFSPTLIQVNTTSKPAVWWVKRDFRVFDNEALCEASKHSHLLVLYVLEPSVLKAADTSWFHIRAQLEAASGLQQSLQKRGGELYFVIDEVLPVFQMLLASLGSFRLLAHQETGNNLTYARDRSVARWCADNMIAFDEYHQNGVVRGMHKREMRSGIQAQRLLQTPVTPAPSMLPPVPKAIESLSGLRVDVDVLFGNDFEFNHLQTVPEIADCYDNLTVNIKPDFTNIQRVTEKSAHRDLHSFLHERGKGYSGGISSPNLALRHGSRLSAHLAWGTISLRTVFAEKTKRLEELKGTTDQSNIQWRKSLNAFRSRLFWHDHFVQRFESATFMEYEALNPAYRDIQYPGSEEMLVAWANGRTGIPLVDACMRCLRATGFINFRMRAMLVSVGCYGLGLHWRDLHYPLSRVFLDYEPGIHLSQVQMQAGVVGINTIRVYNPHKQLIEQDSNCTFVKRWIPELESFSAESIANYQTQPLGDYPAPPANYSDTAKLMKDRIFAVRQSEEGRKASADILERYGSRMPARNRAGWRKQGSQKRPAKNSISDAGNDTNEKEGTLSQQLGLDI